MNSIVPEEPALSIMAALVQLNHAAQTLLLAPEILSAFSTLTPSRLTAFSNHEDSPPVVVEILESEAINLLKTPEPSGDPHQRAPRCSSFTLHEFMSKSWRALQTTTDTILSFIYPPYPPLPNNPRAGDKKYERSRGIANSHSWLDRKVCYWLGFCDVAHLRTTNNEPSSWDEGIANLDGWSGDERVLREIPQYVLDYAPLVHLYSGEQFWPCDIEKHLIHTTPYLNYTPLQARSQHPKLIDLDELNQFDGGRFVFLQSDDNVEERPEWLGGKKNIPSDPTDGDSDDDDDDDNDGVLYDRSPGRGVLYDEDASDRVDGERLMDKIELRRAIESRQLRGGRSDAPAVLLVVDKGNGIVDAFWFYFYSYNLGNVVLNIRFGNHVGDWEHSLVRFQHGVPKAVFFSEHSGGEAYSYEAVEKLDKRPVIYSATGTHAMYATAGIHEYILPLGLLHDVTDRGPLWDPLLNSHMYTYDALTDTLRSSNVTPHAPTQWFYFNGHWGDKIYPLSDRRQYTFAGQYHYVNGPLGPRFKNLGRSNVCQSSGSCVIKDFLDEAGRRRWVGVGEGEEMSQEDVKRFLGGPGDVADEL